MLSTLGPLRILENCLIGSFSHPKGQVPSSDVPGANV